MGRPNVSTKRCRFLPFTHLWASYPRMRADSSTVLTLWLSMMAALAFGSMQGRIQQMPGTVEAETPEVVEHRLPGREVGGEIAPGAARAQHIEDGVEDTAQAVAAQSFFRCSGRQESLQAVPLGLGQAAWIVGAHGGQRNSGDTRFALQNTLLGFLIA